MKKNFFIFFITIFSLLNFSAKAEFGDADFPIGTFQNSPKSYHDAWCRFIKNNCRVRFQSDAMWVEGVGGIYRNQFLNYRYSNDLPDQVFLSYGRGEHYNYITYESKNGIKREALFLFSNRKAQRNFSNALMRWVEQDGRPVPNYKLPNSQGPQDTQNRDEGLNPYDKPPIIDFMKKTTDEKGIKGNINCDSPVWKNKPRCD